MEYKRNSIIKWDRLFLVSSSKINSLKHYVNEAPLFLRSRRFFLQTQFKIMRICKFYENIKSIFHKICWLNFPINFIVTVYWKFLKDLEILKYFFFNIIQCKGCQDDKWIDNYLEIFDSVVSFVNVFVS